MYTKYSVNRYKEGGKCENEKEQENDIFKQENVEAQTPRKESTMACKFLETPKTSHKKEKILIPLPRAEIAYLRPPRSHRSPLTQSSSSFPHPQRSCSPSRHPSEMTIIITSALRKWLTDHGYKISFWWLKRPRTLTCWRWRASLTSTR